MIATLSFRDRFTKREAGDRWSIDFMINDQDLLGYLGISNSDLLGSFGWRSNREYEMKLLNELKEGKFSSSENGLFPLYVCPECGHIECGAIVCEIEIDSGYVVWKNFAHSDGQLPLLSEQYLDSPDIQFDKLQYLKALHELERIISDRKFYTQ